MMASINIDLDDYTASLYAAIPEEQKRKLSLLIGIKLREFLASCPRPIQATMDRMGAEAMERGLTPEILDSILRDKGEEDIPNPIAN